MLIIIKDLNGTEVERASSFEELKIPYDAKYSVYAVCSRNVMRYRDGKLTVGCITLTFDEFSRLEESITKEYNYSDEERAEYLHAGYLLRRYVEKQQES